MAVSRDPAFRTARMRESYDLDAVDDFVDRVIDALEGRPGGRSLTPEKIEAQEFKVVRFREGYSMDDVDDWLDEAAAELRQMRGGGSGRRPPARQEQQYEQVGAPGNGYTTQQAGPPPPAAPPAAPAAAPPAAPPAAAPPPAAPPPPVAYPLPPEQPQPPYPSDPGYPPPHHSDPGYLAPHHSDPGQRVAEPAYYGPDTGYQQVDPAYQQPGPDTAFHQLDPALQQLDPAYGGAQQGPDMERPGAQIAMPTTGLHHIEIWVHDLDLAVQSMGWLFERLGWTLFQAWENGRSWQAPGDGPYVVLERSPDMAWSQYDRTAPGLNHLALAVPERWMVDRVVSEAATYGWRLMFADRHPYAGGSQHYAAYLENDEGFEVEVVAP